MEGPNILKSLFSVVSFFSPIILYAEIHYRFKYFFSFLKKREPEIVSDAPHRLEPKYSLPILVLFKDSNIFPCEICEIHTTIIEKENKTYTYVLLQEPVRINEQLWWKVFHIQLPEIHGWIECEVKIVICINGKKRIYRNDNYRNSTHSNHRIFISSETLPKFNNLYFGEGHSHSSYTNDQVEFGSPVKASMDLSRSMGLSFFCVTDHSYDLDDHPNDYLTNVSSHPKWKSLKDEIEKITYDQVDCIPFLGEEVTCRNTKDENVHFLILENPLFIPGSGDSAEHWFHTRSEYSITEILSLMNENCLAIAAHPFEKISILEKFLLGRGQWQILDFNHENLQGIQFINGKHSQGFSKGYQFWVQQLLSGKRLYLYVGNDAHGNFNKFRQISIPFVKLHESEDQVFGKMRLGVYAKNLTKNEIWLSVKEGRTIATDGPIANFIAEDNTSISLIGGEVPSFSKIIFQALSSSEFGNIHKINILIGVLGKKSEEVLFSLTKISTNAYSKEITLALPQPAYVRAEIWTDRTTSSDQNAHFCFTNPIWIYPANSR